MKITLFQSFGSQRTYNIFETTLKKEIDSVYNDQVEHLEEICTHCLNKSEIDGDQLKYFLETMCNELISLKNLNKIQKLRSRNEVGFASFKEKIMSELKKELFIIQNKN